MATYYVALTGKDTNAGTAAAPFRTINKADQTLPAGGGHTIIVKPGVHTAQAALWKAGASGKINRLVGEPGAIIHTGSTVYDAVRTFSSYWEITGLEIIADSGHGIDTQDAHHVWVHHCFCHDCEGSGISGYQSDWVLIEDNICEKNAGRNGNQCSGISVASHFALSTDTWALLNDGTQWRTIIRRNISRNNVETAAIGGEHTDGNGIIVDWMRNEGKGQPAYPGPILVADNLCHGNGGKGIQVFRSDNVTLRGNTCYRNNLDLKNTGSARAEISTQDASKVTILNNIGVGDPAVDSRNSAAQNSGVGNLWKDNCLYVGTPGKNPVGWADAGTGPKAADGNLLGVDPKLDANFIPQNPAAASMGWRPAGTVIPPVTPPVTPPTAPTIEARLAALEADVAAAKSEVATLSEASAGLNAAMQRLASALAARDAYAAKVVAWVAAFPKP